MVRLLFQVIRMNFPIYSATFGKEAGGHECIMTMPRRLLSWYSGIQFSRQPAQGEMLHIFVVLSTYVGLHFHKE